MQNTPESSPGSQFFEENGPNKAVISDPEIAQTLASKVKRKYPHLGRVDSDIFSEEEQAKFADEFREYEDKALESVIAADIEEKAHYSAERDEKIREIKEAIRPDLQKAISALEEKYLPETDLNPGEAEGLKKFITDLYTKRFRTAVEDYDAGEIDKARKTAKQAVEYHKEKRAE